MLTKHLTRFTVVLVMAVLPLQLRPDFTTFPGRELNFGRKEIIGRFMPARELDIWARNHNMKLLPDSPARELQDFEAEVIAPEGSSFELMAPGRGRVFLYLDLVTFEPLSDADLPRVQWLDVEINGIRVSTVYAGGGASRKNPVILAMDREVMPVRRLVVTLRPSPGDGFFAIWDVFVSQVLEEPTP